MSLIRIFQILGRSQSRMSLQTPISPVIQHFCLWKSPGMHSQVKYKDPRTFPNKLASSLRFFSTRSSLFNDKKLSNDSQKVALADHTNPEEPKKIPATTAAKQLLKNITPRENIYTIPNILTFSRLISSPIIGYLIIYGHPHYALALFAYSCITDYLDGLIARRFKLQSVVGSVIDPLADKTLMITLASCLAVSGDIPLYMAILILGRDALLGISAFYYRYISLPPPKTFLRYWDFSIPSAEVHPTTISKYNTFLQMIYLGSSLFLPGAQHLISVDTLNYCSEALKVLEYIVATTTVLSGLSYVFSKDAVKILKPPN